jgi:hypothetical protein
VDRGDDAATIRAALIHDDYVFFCCHFDCAGIAEGNNVHPLFVRAGARLDAFTRSADPGMGVSAMVTEESERKRTSHLEYAVSAGVLKSVLNNSRRKLSPRFKSHPDNTQPLMAAIFEIMRKLPQSDTSGAPVVT